MASRMVERSLAAVALANSTDNTGSVASANDGGSTPPKTSLLRAEFDTDEAIRTESSTPTTLGASLGTALRAAAASGSEDATSIVEELLLLGADVGYKPTCTPRAVASVAVAIGIQSGQEALANGGKDEIHGTSEPAVASSIPNSTRTALHIACAAANPSVVLALLRAGANPDAQDQGGATPLHLAARPANSVRPEAAREVVEVRGTGTRAPCVRCIGLSKKAGSLQRHFEHNLHHESHCQLFLLASCRRSSVTALTLINAVGRQCKSRSNAKRKRQEMEAPC